MEKTNSVDIATVENQSITFGFPREPEDIRRHLFRGPLQGNPRLIDGALYVSVALEANQDELTANISVANIGCGHAVPTGEPMRSLVLVVEAQGSCGALESTGGMSISDVGGVIAQGVEGVDVSTSGSELDWPQVAPAASYFHSACGAGLHAARASLGTRPPWTLSSLLQRPS